MSDEFTGLIAHLLGPDSGAAAAGPVGQQTVPSRLFGAWRRNWIRFHEPETNEWGPLEADVTVMWVQTASGMGDVRIDPAQTPAESDSSCGITVVDEDAEPMATADWITADPDFAQQPVSNFPEKGWLRWEDDTIMREYAPSGAYEEEWERLAGSNGTTAHLTAPQAPTQTNLYLTGRHVFLAVRSTEADGIHEFSYGVVGADGITATIEVSTLDDCVGQPMPLAGPWQLVSLRD